MMKPVSEKDGFIRALKIWPLIYHKLVRPIILREWFPILTEIRAMLDERGMFCSSFWVSYPDLPTKTRNIGRKVCSRSLDSSHSAFYVESCPKIG
jgi:hypothetical protein